MLSIWLIRIAYFPIVLVSCGLGLDLASNVEPGNSRVESLDNARAFPPGLVFCRARRPMIVTTAPGAWPLQALFF